ncbi:MAG: chromosome segregation protein SMC [Eubacteriales bacterium]|nr:chromosome segregation protein SMC [Eubacteriales bacterium]
MRLNKLEINGFKSFARKTELDFEPGVTAVVGPNGCGKSNISDAVRWVLGEQSARALRGAKMEDVIFNGTEQRKPLSFCEVALTFDNADGQLPTDYTEVTVTRRVYRSGDSEYLLNGSGCRLKDIQELFRDTGIGKEGYSIISQGKVEEILSNKSGDRRAAFEEAAGVMKYRVRKEDAERKLENTKKNLVRLEDILDELETQIGPLSEQSEVARKYLRLRDELKDIEVNVFLSQYDKLNERIKNLAEAMRQMDDEIAGSGDKEASLAAACAEAEEKERSLNAFMNELQNKLLTLSSGMESNTGDAKVMQERMANIESERVRLREQIGQAEKTRRDILDGLSGYEENAEEKNQELTACGAALEKIQGEAALLNEEIEKKEERLEEQKQSLIDAMNRISEARSQSSRLSAIKDTMYARLSAIDEEEARVKAESEKLQREFKEANGHFQILQADLARRENAKKTAIEAVNEANQRIVEAQRTQGELSRAREAARARIRVLEEMKKAHEGYYSSVRNVLTDTATSLELKKRIIGVVADLINVPKEYEVAVEMSLGSALQNIVTPNEQDAKYVIEYLRSKQYGRATLLPVTSMRARVLTPQEKQSCAVKGYIGVASELVGYDEKYRNIFENLLGRTVLVEDLDAGIAINKQARGAFRIATLKGDIINPGGSMTGGSSQKREFSLIGRTREIEELHARLKEADTRIEESEREAAVLADALRKANADMEEANKNLHVNDVELATHREKVDIIKKYVDENAAELERLQLERSQIGDNLADIERQSQQAEESRQGLESGNAVTQEDIKKAQAELMGLRARQEESNENVTAHKVKLMGFEKELNAIRGDIARMRREAEQCEKGIAHDNGVLAESDEQIKKLQADMQNLGGRIDEERQDISLLQQQLHDAENERDQHVSMLDDMRARRENLSMELAELRERRHRSELNQSKAQMESQNMQDRIWEDYALTYDNALSMRRPIALTASHLRIDELKQDIRALGDVNVNAIADYQNVKERFDSLTVQIDDLHKAENDLQALIEDLVRTMENEFKKQFSKIQDNFAVVFSELFGGGRAELVLSDKSDILNCDIDIIAQPPGKKLQMLSLLSGGERALTAIALIFAILKLKPTAFCILDEIESALDEVNVSNFANYVKRYSEDTQFILITHRKGSMEVSDSIYGVSMEERGISRVISARFSEYEAV